MICAGCMADVPEDDLFCENCGVKLAAPAGTAVCFCGGTEAELDEDGFCGRCGRRVRRPASDHVEEAPSAQLAAVSDRGLRHDRNEDRFALAEWGDGVAITVCDGVSATPHSEVAAETVANFVTDRLKAALTGEESPELRELLTEAIAGAAAQLASQSHGAAAENNPSTTVVAALVSAGTVTVGWVGDSRAYWIDAEGVRALTRDHSWVNAVVEGGEFTVEQAEAMPQAHAITRWVGADAGEAATAEVVQQSLDRPGILLLCTDGLWNYAPEPETLGALIAQGDADALNVARRLVAFANEAGGRDNITVAVLLCPGVEVPLSDAGAEGTGTVPEA